MTVFLSKIFTNIIFLSLIASFNVHCMIEKSKASDFQIYQLLSAVKNDSQFYVPYDIIQEIMINVSKRSCYENYRSCLREPDTILNFINDSMSKSMSHASIVYILKTCLSCSGKSLDQITDIDGRTVLHRMVAIDQTLRSDYAKIVCLAAGSQAWDLVTMGDYSNYTVLHCAFYSSELFINELLSTAPCSEELWKLACQETDFYDTVLHRLVTKSSTAGAIKTLLSCAPSSQEVCRLINQRNNEGESPLDVAEQYGVREIIEILESYRSC